MDVNIFDFDLPEQLIAQTPIEKRASSRLMVVDPLTNKVVHRTFNHLLDYLQEGDCLVINNTRVLPARIYGEKRDTGAKIEVLLLHCVEGDRWKTLVKPAKRIHEGSVVSFGNGILNGVCVNKYTHGECEFVFEYEGKFLEVLEDVGEMPLPPYIKTQLMESDRYQTIYAEHVGSVAAPTAGLHFTEQLLSKIREKGVFIASVTLHVGLGTFRPVTVDSVEQHKMHAEFYSISESNATLLNKVKRSGGRIIAVGTTTTRTLETIKAKNNGQFTTNSGWTDIFIYPGYQFQAIDGLVTNFHLPKSSLIMLVSALASRGLIMDAYEQAIKSRYRFFSFGDAMLILEGSLSYDSDKV